MEVATGPSMLQAAAMKDKIKWVESLEHRDQVAARLRAGKEAELGKGTCNPSTQEAEADGFQT